MAVTHVTIYHNPRCTKSKQTLQLLRDRGIEPHIVEYLEDPPDAERVGRLIDLLGIEPGDLLRKKEAPYKELGLTPDADKSTVGQAIAEQPILLERPVVVVDEKKAAIGRPPENVLEIL